jgi:hypothetical protein
MSLEFPFSGFYIYDDSDTSEQYLKDKCKLIDLQSLSHINTLTKDLSALHINCRSMFAKQHELDLFVHSFPYRPSFCCFTETWLTSSSGIPFINDYVGYSKIRGTRGGGVYVLFMFSIHCNHMNLYYKVLLHLLNI